MFARGRKPETWRGGMLMTEVNRENEEGLRRRCHRLQRFRKQLCFGFWKNRATALGVFRWKTDEVHSPKRPGKILPIAPSGKVYLPSDAITSVVSFPPKSVPPSSFSVTSTLTVSPADSGV